MNESKDDNVSIEKNRQLSTSEKDKEQTFPLDEGFNQRLKKDINDPIFRDLGKKEKNGVL